MLWLFLTCANWEQMIKMKYFNATNTRHWMLAGLIMAVVCSWLEVLTLEVFEKLSTSKNTQNVELSSEVVDILTFACVPDSFASWGCGWCRHRSFFQRSWLHVSTTCSRTTCCGVVFPQFLAKTFSCLVWPTSVRCCAIVCTFYHFVQ